MVGLRSVFALAALGSLCLHADVVTLKNGDKVSGSILKTDDKSLIVKSEFMGEVKIDRAAITSIVSAEPLTVAIKNGPTVLGTITTKGDEAVITKPDKATQLVALANIDAIRNSDAQKAFLREEERVKSPKFFDFWQGAAALNIAGATGNSTATSIGTTMGAKRDAGKNVLGIYFDQLYASQSTTPPAGATANRIGGGARIDRFLTKKLYVFGTADFLYNQFLDLDLRSVLGGGLGYQFYKNERGFFEAGAGGDWNNEQYSTGLTRNAAEIMLNEHWNWKPNPRFTFYERLSFFPNLSDTGQYRIVADAGIIIPISKMFSFTANVNNNYQSNPPAGKKTNDFVYTTGVAANFKQE